jgi:hypothetical protein
MGSTATSIVDRTESPTPARNLSIDVTPIEGGRARGKSNANQTTQSSPTSNATSPYATSDSQPGDSEYVGEGLATPKSAGASDEKPIGYASIKNTKIPRTMYGHGYVEGWTKSREALKVRDREKARQLSMSQRAARGEFGVINSPMAAGSTPSDSTTWHGTPQSSPYRDERSWLGDKTSASGDEQSNGWSAERTHRVEGERNGSVSLSSSTNINDRPTRRLDGHQRHAALQREAEQMEPGDYKPTRGEPRRDWAGEERMKRVERTDGGSRDGSFSFGPSTYQQSHNRSQPGSTPESRLGSRHPSLSSSDNEEGTTALPRIGLGSGSFSGAAGAEKADKEGEKAREKEKREDKERHLFERIGFKKRK